MTLADVDALAVRICNQFSNSYIDPADLAEVLRDELTSAGVVHELTEQQQFEQEPPA